MKWQPLNDKVKIILAAPIVIPAAVILFPAIIIGVWIPDKIQAWKRKRFGPYFDKSQTWFAWHPVKLDWSPGDDWSEQWAWLENVERKLGDWANNAISYCPQEQSHDR